MRLSAVSQLSALFQRQAGCAPQTIAPLPRSGSDREYYRLSAGQTRFMGAYNPNVAENGAFFHLTNHFHALGFPVPALHAVSPDQTCYLIDDLGDCTLFQLIRQAQWGQPESAETVELLRRTLSLLARLQVQGAVGLDFSRCYPKPQWDHQSALWDLNYFKYCFLKPSGIPFDEVALDADLVALADGLAQATGPYFHYRDFQSRNVMIVRGEPFLIDYQGGRRGPCLYDAVSFLFQARAALPDSLRDDLMAHYIQALQGYTPIAREVLMAQLPPLILFRTLQVLGAYGFRGFFERRSHFLESIPLAAVNIDRVEQRFVSHLPELQRLLRAIRAQYAPRDEQPDPPAGLTVSITSFSYRGGYPLEHSVHGGGFVFDCRGLPNPGREEEFRHLTGLDAPVARFLDANAQAQAFLARTQELVLEAVRTYRARAFSHLSVAYGCTGGQHRSVYSASALARRLQGEEGVRVVLKHRELQA